MYVECVFVMSVCMCRVEKRAQTLVRWQAEILYIQSSLVNKMWLWAKTGNWHPHRITDVTQIMYPLLREMIPQSSLLANRNNLLPLKSWGITDFAWPLPMPTDDLHVNAVLIHWLWAGCAALSRLLHSTRSHHPTSHCQENTFTAWHLYVVD